MTDVTTTLATDGTVRTGHPLDEHEFCPKCGMCTECGDCAIWGCGNRNTTNLNDGD